MCQVFSREWLLLFVVFAGCGGEIEYLDELEFLPVTEKLTEVPFGEFYIPVPANSRLTPTVKSSENQLALQFKLYALAVPSRSEDLAEDWQRTEAKLREEIIRICRHASIEELSEPSFSAIRARMSEVIMDRFGRSNIRRLVFDDITWEPF